MNLLQLIALLVTGSCFGWEVYVLFDFIKMNAPKRDCFITGLVALLELALFILNAICIGVRLR